LPLLQLSTQIVGSLLALEAMDEEAPIRLYINSPGGTPYSVIGVVDAMQQVKCPIQTVALGACYSYSSLILVREQRWNKSFLYYF
jgi:ATP-dependent Clp protease protease subunit